MLTNQGQCRVFMGKMAEQLVAYTFGGRLAQQNFKTCPDIVFPLGKFGEVKSCGRSNEVIMFKFRIEKYDEFDKPLKYYIVKHSCKLALPSSEDVVRADFIKNLSSITVADKEKVHELVRTTNPSLTRYRSDEQIEYRLKFKHIQEIGHTIKIEVKS